MACLLITAMLGTSATAGGLVSWHEMTLRSTDGSPLIAGDAKWTVVCFLGTECPLAKLYGPRLQRLADTFADDEVAFLGINSNVQDSAEEIDAYVADLGIRFPVAKDADQTIAVEFRAKRTPEVFVVDAAGLIRYQGRIDNQYSPGIVRAAPTEHDLRDALQSLVDGREIARPKTESVGCLITRLPRKPVDASQASVTFHRDIVAILNANCVECHRRGEIGPMELTDYDEVVGWGDMILEVIDEKRMPPWHADPDIGEFAGARELSRQDRDKIATWIREGMPEGDPKDRPESPVWNDGWHLETKPDVEFVMRDRPFDVAAEGVIDYQYFVVDPKWETDRWVRAAQVIPGNASVVHHCIVFVRPPDGSRFDGIGWLGAYVPGQRTIELPPGHARHVPAGSKLVFQMHYTPNGTAASDLSRMGVWFEDAKAVTHEVATRVAIDHEFEIEPGEASHSVSISVGDLPPEGRMLGVSPHMHLRGKAFSLAAKQTGGERPLLEVPQYDFNWQHWYQFAEPVALAEIDSLELTMTFDNSPQNPTNPAPHEYVFWGDQTWEEMAVAFFDVALPRGTAGKRKPWPKPTQDQIAEREKRIAKLVDQYIADMDANGDGIIEREEVPATVSRFSFREFDRNGDRKLDRSEVEKAVSYRL